MRELRIATGMSQVVFGEKCGFYQTYLSRIERGQATGLTRIKPARCRPPHTLAMHSNQPGDAPVPTGER